MDEAGDAKRGQTTAKGREARTVEARPKKFERRRLGGATLDVSVRLNCPLLARPWSTNWIDERQRRQSARPYLVLRTAAQEKFESAGPEVDEGRNGGRADVTGRSRVERRERRLGWGGERRKRKQSPENAARREPTTRSRREKKPESAFERTVERGKNRRSSLLLRELKSGRRR